MSELQKNQQENKLYQNNIRLNKPKHARLLIARAVNMFNKNMIDYKDLRAIGYVAGKLLNAFETIEIEKEVEEIREIIDKMQGNKKGRWSA